MKKLEMNVWRVRDCPRGTNNDGDDNDDDDDDDDDDDCPCLSAIFLSRDDDRDFFCDSSSSSSGSKKVVSGPGTMPSPFFFSQTQPSRSKAKIASVRASRRRRCWSAEGFPKRRRNSSWSRARPLKLEGASVTGPGVWEILEAGTHLIKDIFFGPR